MKQVSENIFVETTFQGCNSGFIITSEGIIIIDTPFRPSDAKKWADYISSKGNVQYIINTENHIDHVLGNTFFPGTVISHIGTKTDFDTSRIPMDQIIKLISECDPEGIGLMEKYEPKEPKITFTDKMELYLGNLKVELIHLPGHTFNEIGVFVPSENVIFTGDNVVNKVRPFFHECCPLEWIQSLEFIKNLEPTVIIPGHGEICDKNFLGEMRSYIEEIFNQVREGISKGLPKEEIVDSIYFSDRMPLLPYQEVHWSVLKTIGIFRIYEQLLKYNEG